VYSLTEVDQITFVWMSVTLRFQPPFVWILQVWFWMFGWSFQFIHASFSFIQF